MLSTVFSAGLLGIDGYLVTVECDSQTRIPVFELVGLPDLAVKEAKERVRTACENSGFRFPAMALTLNLAPADRKKEGSAFDTAILMGILLIQMILGLCPKPPTKPFLKKVFRGFQKTLGKGFCRVMKRMTKTKTPNVQTYIRGRNSFAVPPRLSQSEITLSEPISSSVL